ncbi:MSF1-domain-containing protein [Mollisia scopiformis]|uniref:MSF1-domain-containing protein n=1 Tax=Mollisia scopiformis TaxID=149040 RepID=A0A194WVK7_MOLSC|nr:MSF1-domain-containing protein [Mollisia scopiformis]KUJ12000.1 MSF1-domain-containing protein [Mollisia scopiformis]
MKVFSNDEVFDYSWEEVSTANWRKYCPWNDKSTHVIAVDTLSRSVDPESGILRTERLITCKQSAPKWLASLMGGNETSHVFETSYVDPVSKKVTMISSNLTFANIISVQESVVYQPLSATKTQFVQNAKITALCGGWQKVKNAVEDATVTRFGENARKGKEGFEAVLEMSRRVFREEKEKARMEVEVQEKMAA